MKPRFLLAGIQDPSKVHPLLAAFRDAYMEKAGYVKLRHLLFDLLKMGAC